MDVWHIHSSVGGHLFDEAVELSSKNFAAGPLPGALPDRNSAFLHMEKKSVFSNFSGPQKIYVSDR